MSSQTCNASDTTDRSGNVPRGGGALAAGRLSPGTRARRRHWFLKPAAPCNLVNSMPTFILSSQHPWAKSRLACGARLAALLLLCNSVFYGYSVLTHEAIVDALLGCVDPENVVEAVSRGDARGIGAGARLRLWRLHFAGYGVLSLQQPILQ